MNEPVISIALEASEIWRATGRYLGYHRHPQRHRQHC